MNNDTPIYDSINPNKALVTALVLVLQENDRLTRGAAAAILGIGVNDFIFLSDEVDPPTLRAGEFIKRQPDSGKSPDEVIAQFKNLRAGHNALLLGNDG